MREKRPGPHIFLIAGESSGDQLGAALMRALIKKTQGAASFSGIGGPMMQAEGMRPLFPSSDIAMIGPSAILKNFPALLKRLHQAVQAVLDRQPDALVVIDSPEFTQRVAKRVRKALPHLPIIKYVAPQVWAWRPGRAKYMRRYINEILALFPFEPECYRHLGGPLTTYVGHPLIERRDLYEVDANKSAAKSEPLLLVVLPGSRASEVKRLLKPFGETVALLRKQFDFQLAIPAVPHLRGLIMEKTKDWQPSPMLVEDGPAKWALFRRASAALAASGTVTLELALAQVPMVVAYQVEAWMAPILRRLIKVSTIVLPNLILGRNIIPEFYQQDVCAEILAPQLAKLFVEGPSRQNQLAGFKDLSQIMSLPDGKPPADMAAERVLANLSVYLREASGT